MQGIITLYLANRLAPRDWDHPRMGRAGWTLAAGYQLVMMAIAHANPQKPLGTAAGYVLWGALAAVTSVLLWSNVRSAKSQAQPFQASRVMDVLAFGSLTVFLVLGTLFAFGPTVVTSQPLNLFAVTLENIWVLLCGVAFFVYRYRRHADVTV